MQEMGVNWAQIGQVAMLAFAFGVLYAALVRWMSTQGVRNMTAFVVALGVLVTVLISSIVIGLIAALAVLVAFGASGMPMIVEYVVREHAADKARRAAMEADTREAKRLAKDLLR